MGSAPHRVRRQVWRIRAAGAADAFALRREVRAAWDDVLLPALEAAFDAAAGDDRVVRIPRLELRLRLDRADDLAAELPRLIREAAGVELALARRGGVPEVWGVEDAATTTPAQDRRATLRHYLRTGALPWAAAGAAPAAETAALLREAVRAEGPRLAEAIAAEASPRAFAFRLLQLVGEAEAPAWVAALPPRVPPLWRRVLLRLLAPAAAPAAVTESAADAGGGAAADAGSGADGEAAPAPSPVRWSVPSRHVRLETAAALLAVTSTQAVENTVDALVTSVAGAMDGGAGDSITSILASIPEIAAARGTAKRGPSVDRAARRGETARRASAEGAREDAHPPAARKEDAAERPGDPRVVGRTASSSSASGAAGSAASGARPADEEPAAAAELLATRPEAAVSAEQELSRAVANAGLILLHPFVPMLFEHTRVREGNAIPPRELPRAAALLHYLATGRDEVLEWELGLAKVLMGLAPEQPLLVGGGLLRPEDREQCEDLLHSAITHWSVLKTTSPALVRETFLQRGGLLRRDPHGWTLRVEHAPFDVLLSQLPWSIGICRLPWMPHPLYTEWTTTP